MFPFNLLWFEQSCSKFSRGSKIDCFHLLFLQIQDVLNFVKMRFLDLGYWLESCFPKKTILENLKEFNEEKLVIGWN